jgi:hypothetical protein
MATHIKSKASQEFVPIKEVRDGIIVLKDGTLRAIVMASTVNFALKSQDEQTSIIYQFQNFLNSLNFSVQICVQSRRLDISPYLNLLKEREREQNTDLMKLQVKQYIEFVQTLTESTNIMTKTFFVVVPYNNTSLKSSTGGLDTVFRNKNEEEESLQKETSFEENKVQLDQRVAVVEEGLTRCGVRILELNTEQLVELFYKSFNPGEEGKPAQRT